LQAQHFLALAAAFFRSRSEFHRTGPSRVSIRANFEPTFRCGCAKGRWIGNRMIERLWRSLKYESIYLNPFETGSEACLGIGKWLAYYNAERPHSAHGISTPQEAYETKKTPMRLAAQMKP